VHMDGDLALKYARVRHGTDDIDRAGRQQQVLLAARDKALRLNLLPKLPSLMATVLDSVKTDLQPGEILALARLANQLESDKIQSRVIDYTMVINTVTPTGADVLLPQRDKVRILVDEMFTAPARKNGLESEGATIEVLNGAGTLGLAAQMAALLKEQGFNVVSVENADRNDYSHTLIIDYAGKPGTLAALAKLLQVSKENTLTEIGKQPGPATIRIIVGKDFALPTSR